MSPTHSSVFERKEILQAVIIAESFDNQFDPVTREIPKVLLPLVNTPLLCYNLVWLHRCGIEDVVIYCRATPHSALIKKHVSLLLERRQWSSMTVRVFATDDIRSTGDALRDLYAKRIIVNDFILMRGDTIGNLDLERMLAIHKSNKQHDPKVALTCLFMPVELSNEDDVQLPQASQNSKDSKQNYSSLRVSTITDMRGKILTYERHRRGSDLMFPTYLAYSHPKLVITAQMPDPSISICGCDLPGLFADSFDCNSLHSMIRSLIQPDDLNECSVYQYVVRHGYATTVATWRDYERVSMGIIQRKWYPLVPEVSMTTGRHRYLHDSFVNHYFTASSNVGYPTIQDRTMMRLQQFRIGVKVVCGEAMQVSTNCRLRSCCFGNHCTVEDNAQLDTVFVGDNCTIKSGCELRHCYLGNNVTLLPNTIIEPGCVVASGVTLGPDQTIKRATLLATKQIWQKLDEVEKPEKPVSVSANAVLFPRDSQEAEEGFTTNEDGQTLPIWGIKEDDFIFVPEEDDSNSSSSGGAEDGGADVIDAAGQQNEMDEDERIELQFKHEVMESLVLSIKDTTNASNVAIEINASRYAYNIKLEHMQLIVLKGVLLCYEEAKTGEEYTESSEWPAWPTLKQGIHRYKDVLQKYLKTNVDFLNTFERMASEDERVLATATKVLYELNQELELLDDGFLLHWFRQGGASKDTDNPSFVKLKQTVSEFLTWLENAEEESSEEDEDED
uniref:Translation initiation factor eIF2B subunit epsilon n=1 Tax=Hirondellea gigas TaxID=1518452 RepID=A0A2P2I1T0_9CRUS